MKVHRPAEMIWGSLVRVHVRKGEGKVEAGMSMAFTRHGLDKQYCTNNGSL